MLKRLGSIGAVVAVGALAVGSIGPATGQTTMSDDDDDHMVLKVWSTVAEEAFLDHGDTDVSLGDQFVFTANLTKGDRTVGHTGATCTITSVENSESLCTGTAWFRRGQISVQGLVTEEDGDFELPITGGTGAFEGAGGTLVIHPVSEGVEVLTFHIES